MNNTDVYHIPVLLNESIEGMNLHADGIYADMTFGGGGHSKEILRRMGEDCHLYSFDQDEDAEKNIVDDKRFTFVRSNFRYLRNFLRYYGVEQLDGILADLGVSSHHFDDSERGFSFRFDGKLDMRMNKRAGMTAADIVNTYDEEKLADVFYLYGELKNSRKLAATIAKARQQKARDGPALFPGGSDRGSALEEEYYRAYIWPKELAGTVANVERHKKFELLPKSDYCGLRLPAAHYTPDFIVEYTNGTVEVVEVKHEAIRALQGSYVYRRRLFIEKYARPNGWIFTEYIKREGRKCND